MADLIKNNPVYAVLLLIVWFAIYLILCKLGSAIYDSTKNLQKKRGLKADTLYDEKKKNFRFTVTAFFVLIPILVIIGCVIE